MENPTQTFRIDRLLFFAGWMLIIVLAVSKWESAADFMPSIEEVNVQTPEDGVHLSMNSVDIQGVSLSLRPISNYQFHAFVLSTGHKSDRHKRGYWPNWEYPGRLRAEEEDSLASWLAEPDAPVRWLTRADAEAFCAWQRPGARLPSVKELNELAANETASLDLIDSLWLWTKDTLATAEPTRPGAKAYQSQWNKSGKLRHRRAKDIEGRRPELSETSFLIAWKSSHK